MQGEDLTSDAVVNLAVALRQDGVKLWYNRCYREAEIHLGAYHVQERSCNKEELIDQGDELLAPTDIEEEGKPPEDVSSSIIDTSSEGEEEHVMKTEAMMLRDETAKMWQYRGLVAVENNYHEYLTLTHSTGEGDDGVEVHEDDRPSASCDKQLDTSHKHEDIVSDSEESFHSLEEFIPNELSEQQQSLIMMDSDSECYDDAERTLLESTAVQTTAVTVCDGSCQTNDDTGHSICVQTEAVHLLDASVNTVAIATSTISTNTVVITTDNVTTNTITMVTVDNATNTDTMELVDTATNTVTKTTVDAIIQTEKLLMSRSQTEYESLIEKYKKYIEALKTEVTQEKSQRLVAEQMVTIVQSEVESLRQRNVDLTSQQIKLENELSETKVEYLQSQKMLKERDQRIVELNDSLFGTSLLVKKLEEQSTQVLMGRGGIDYMLEAKLSSGRALEAEQKVEVLQAELLQSRSEVKSLLDKISELTREKAENVSHVVHTQLLQIADEKALQAETKCRQLQNEVLSLKRQLQTTNGLSEASGPTSSLLSIANQPLSTYSLYGTTTSSTNFLHTYPSTLGYHGNSSYTSSYTTQQPSHGGLLLRKPQPTSYSPVTSSYGYTLTTTSETDPLNFGYKYQTSITTMSPLLTNTSTKLVTTDTVEKSRDQVTMDTEKDRNRQDNVQNTEATLVLPELVDNTQLTSQVQPTAASHASGESSDWSSSEEGDDYSPLKPSMLANKTAQWEWRTQQEHQSHITTSPKIVTRSSSVKTGPPVAPKPVRTNRSHSNLTATMLEESSSFNKPAKHSNLKIVSRTKGPKGRTLPRKKDVYSIEPELSVTVPEI